VVHTLASVHALKRAQSRLSIQWLVNTEWAPLLVGNPDLDQVIEFPRNEFRGAAGMFKLAAWARKTKLPPFDLALDFQGLARSGLLGWFSAARRIHCLGDAELLPRMLAHHVVPSIRNIHAVERYLKLITDLGIIVEHPLEFPLPPGNKPAGFHSNAPYLLVHPFSRGKNKSIAVADLEQLCRMMQPVPVVLAGTSTNQLDLPANTVDLLNRTSLSELIWLIRHAHFTLSVDSGPMHIAAAITGRVLGIHNWTNPKLVGPYHPEARVWKNGAITQVQSIATTSPTGRGEDFQTVHLPPMVEFIKSHF